MAKLLIIHGPNLNLLGQRDQQQYGSLSLDELNQQLTTMAAHYTLECFQSNAEHEIIDKIQSSAGQVDFIIINPAAFTHTSIAMRDALLAVQIPFIEVHLSNIYAREAFRQHSYFSDIAQGVVCGLGPTGYYAALAAAIEKLN